MASGDDLVGCTFLSGMNNIQYGVWQSRCCGDEIVLYPDLPFPRCNRHKGRLTQWVLIATDILHPPKLAKTVSVFVGRKQLPMAMQGRAFDEQEIQRIITLLSQTDMTIPDIAARMRCSRGAVASINRRWRLRIYNDARSRWERTKSKDESPNAA